MDIFLHLDLELANGESLSGLLDDNQTEGSEENQGVISLEGSKYSIGSDDSHVDSSDNSSEGFFTKIKNLLIDKPNSQNERFRKNLNKMLGRLAGVKIAAGHLNNGMDIVVKEVQKVIPLIALTIGKIFCLPSVKSRRNSQT